MTTTNKYEELEKKHEKIITFLAIIMIFASIPSIMYVFNKLESTNVNLIRELHKKDDAKVETKTVTVTNVSLKEISRHLFKEDRKYGVTIQTDEYDEPIFISDVGDALKVKVGDEIELSAIFEPNNVRYVQDVNIINNN